MSDFVSHQTLTQILIAIKDIYFYGVGVSERHVAAGAERILSTLMRFSQSRKTPVVRLFDFTKNPQFAVITDDFAILLTTMILAKTLAPRYPKPGFSFNFTPEDLVKINVLENAAGGMRQGKSGDFHTAYISLCTALGKLLYTASIEELFERFTQPQAPECQMTAAPVPESAMLVVDRKGFTTVLGDIRAAIEACPPDVVRVAVCLGLRSLDEYLKGPVFPSVLPLALFGGRSGIPKMMLGLAQAVFLITGEKSQRAQELLDTERFRLSPIDRDAVNCMRMQIRMFVGGDCVPSIVADSDGNAIEPDTFPRAFYSLVYFLENLQPIIPFEDIYKHLLGPKPKINTVANRAERGEPASVSRTLAPMLAGLQRRWMHAPFGESGYRQMFAERNGMIRQHAEPTSAPAQTASGAVFIDNNPRKQLEEQTKKVEALTAENAKLKEKFKVLLDSITHAHKVMNKAIAGANK